MASVEAIETGIQEAAWSTRPSAYAPREKLILEHCRGKTVLHLGCIGETEAPTEQRVTFFLSNSSLHSRISQVARSLVGIDLDRDSIVRLRDRGVQDVYVGDAEDLAASDLPRAATFDVVVAGDLVEHLSNPGRMLETIKSHIASGGRLIITTPNAFGLPNYIRFNLGTFREGGGHVHSYSSFTLCNLLARHGWKTVDLRTCFQGRSRHGLRALGFRGAKSILSLNPKWGGTLFAVAEVRD